MTAAGDTVAAYWAAAEDRDWPRFAALVTEDVVYEAPQSRERVRGVIRLTEDGSSQAALTFFDFGADGLITHITDYWPDPYEPPANRAALTERF
jgi:hypothetical protein